MDKQEIDKWLHKWHDEGSISVDFESDTYDAMLDDLAKLKIANVFDLMILILGALSDDK